MFAFELPEEAARMTVGPDWNLGSLCVTHGVADFLDKFAHELHLDASLRRHLAGDYGLLSERAEDQRRTDDCRRRGVQFKSMYQWNEQAVCIATDPLQGNTIVCLAEED
jgi:hypothetical protein